jgi:seryl-tRNA synthetase
MLDLKFIRENAELVKQAVANKHEKADIDAILALDEQKRKLQFEFDNLRARQNLVSKDIPELKKKGEDATALLAEMKEIAETLKAHSARLTELEDDLRTRLLWAPNLPLADVPVGLDASANIEVHHWGQPAEFGFTPLDHIALAERNKLMDFRRGAKVTGSGFFFYTGAGALLERALINYMLDFHILRHGYVELKAPFAVNRTTMTGTGQLPKLEADMYHIDEEDLFMIPTAEVPVTNFHADEILSEAELPVKYVCYTPCFRREAGSYGKDTKGLQRVHQFNKVEMVRFTRPEESNAALEEMVRDAGEILESLGLHYRVVLLSTGDMSFASAKTYDLEVWAPGGQKYLEVSSVSTFTDFQARRANIRYRTADGKVAFLHTLNGSGLATPRTFIALVETWQQPDGSIRIPEPLRPYLQGRETL